MERYSCIRHVPRGTAPAAATHVIAWVPPYLTGDGGEGWWDLLTISAWDAFAEPGHDRENHDLPRLAAAADLARWAAALLGQAVVTAAPRFVYNTVISARRPVIWRPEPVIAVIPAGVPAPAALALTLSLV